MEKTKDIVTAENRNKVMAALNQHIGKANAISMTALYDIVFDRPWIDKINDTRALRTLITAIKDDGIAVCSSSSKNGGGYYIPAEGDEFVDYLEKRKSKALTILWQYSQAKKVSLYALYGQLQLEHLGAKI